MEISMELLSRTQMSCLFTGAVSSKTDARQAIMPSYTVPDIDSCRLSAELILEEALETIEAMGFEVRRDLNDGKLKVHHAVSPPRLEDMIDGACDVIYVATGLLSKMGVPDIPHMIEVCRANDSKFPGGFATIDGKTGKYLKPPGWVPPNHSAVREKFQGFSLAKIAQDLVDRQNTGFVGSVASDG